MTLAIAACLLTLSACALAPGTATAIEPTPKLWRSCEGSEGNRSGANQCFFPSDLTVDPENGHLYIADLNNNRINELTAWGEFVKSWGWGVEDGSPELQTCTAETGCLKGLQGDGAGQLSLANALASDSEGNVFVYDREYFRVQKFDREGNFLLMFGADVNKTKVEEGAPEAQRNLCTAVSGDVCQAGVKDSGPGGFTYRFYGTMIDVGPGDVVYVGDVNRVQKFDDEGAYEGEIPVPGKVVSRVAVEPSTGNLYITRDPTESLTEQNGFAKISPSGETLCTSPEGFSPGGMAVNPEGDVYVRTVWQTSFGKSHVITYNPDCTPKSGVLPFGKDELREGGGLAFGSPCFTKGGLVYAVTGVNSRSSAGISIPEEHFVSAYGSPPDKVELCPPPPESPVIDAQYASSVEATEAMLRARINPRFWADTRYYLEYGTQPCSGGGCAKQPAAPGALLGAGAVGTSVTIPDIYLSGLASGTTYHYRFVATSHCHAAEPDFECTTIGAEHTFRTFPEAGEPNTECENQSFRIGPSALLPDCRAYELVSPLDKEGGDIITLDEPTHHTKQDYTQSAISGDRVTYASYRAFGDATSAPANTQYIASRGEGAWQTEEISPPRERARMLVTGMLNNEYKLFSPDLCQGWLRTQYDPPLAPGAIERYSNLYRRDFCGDGGYEALTIETPANEMTVKPSFPGEHYYTLELQGTSADGAKAIYVVADSFAGASPQPEKCLIDPVFCHLRLYEYEGGQTHFVCVLPNRAPNPGPCSAGNGREALGKSVLGSFANAISDDGERIFWTAALDAGTSQGAIYVRLNPDQAESARQFGTAVGTGNSIGPATGIGNLINGSNKVNSVAVLAGGFAVGQEVSGMGIKAGSKITVVEEPSAGVFRLTLDKTAGATVTGTEITGAASPVVSNVVTESGAFVVGQEISGEGVPGGATVTAIGAGTLTLSVPAKKTLTSGSLSATSSCTEATKACTVAVSAAAEALEGANGSEYYTAAEDGSKAIFRTGQDLYEFTVDTEETSLIAEDVKGLLGASDDASRIYLVSSKDLGGGGSPSGPNLYLYEAGAGLRFIARLVKDDLGLGSSFSEIPIYHLGRVTPDGLHAAFVSFGELTGYDNHDAQTGTPAGEVFLYDAAAKGGAGNLVCASCNPTNARPRAADFSDVNFGGATGKIWLAAQVQPFSHTLYASRLLADDGSHLFFEAADALVPRDTNGRVDVYEWEEAGRGDCGEASVSYSPHVEGCVDLISSGRSDKDSRFQDADPDGSDVFFTTSASLAGGDYGLVDIYDAREGGGFPEPAASPPFCEGEACQSPPEAPNDPTPASESFQGAGNVKEEAAPPARKPCAKGKVRRKGRCVVKPHKKAAKRAKRQRRAGR